MPGTGECYHREHFPGDHDILLKVLFRRYSRKRLRVLELIHSHASSKQQSWDVDLGLSIQALCILLLTHLGLAASLDDGVKQAVVFG